MPRSVALRPALLSLLLPILLPLRELPAQNVTVPATMNGVEGGGGSSIPFGLNTPVRYQAIYDGQELPWAGPRVLTGIALRADNTTPNTTSFPAKGYLQLNVLVSTSPVTAETASTAFAENYGSDVMMALPGASLQLPAQPPLPGVRPANIVFAFPVPWVYGMTPARNNLPAPTSLLFEVQVLSQPTGAYRLDNLSSCSSQATAFGNVGPACQYGTGPVTLTPDATMEAGTSFTYAIDSAPPSSVFWLLLNLSASGGLGGNAQFPLPYPMFDPNNPSLPSPALSYLTRWSAPDCWFNIDPVAGQGGTTDTTGRGYTSIQLPAGRRFLGMALYAQVIVYAQTVNPLQFITSLGQQTNVCGPLGVARLYAFGSTTATTGTLQIGQGPVLEVR